MDNRYSVHFHHVYFIWTGSRNHTLLTISVGVHRLVILPTTLNQGKYKRHVTSDVMISLSLEATLFGVKLTVPLWNLTAVSVALLPRRLSNFKAIGQLYTHISWPWDFARSIGKRPYFLVNTDLEIFVTKVWNIHDSLGLFSFRALLPVFIATNGWLLFEAHARHTTGPSLVQMVACPIRYQALIKANTCLSWYVIGWKCIQHHDLSATEQVSIGPGNGFFVQSHYLNQCWRIVSCSHGNRFQWNL